MTRPAAVSVPRIHSCRAASRSTLSRFLRQSGLSIPPVPIDRLARWMDMQVVLLYSTPNECSAIVSTKEKLIGVNAKHHVRRRRFSVAHELGHIIMKHPPESKCTKGQIAVFNIEADYCASELLMPLDAVPQHREKDAMVLARLFDVSEEAMVRKLEEAKKISGVRASS